MQPQEQRVIAAFPDYAAREDVIVRVSDGKEIKARLNKRTGYMQVQVVRDGKRFTRNVNFLVCEAYYGPRPTPKHESCHCDGVRTNNHPRNLYWGTKRHNGQDRVFHGTVPCGEANAASVLNRTQVRVIASLKVLPKAMRPSAAKVGVMFSVSANSILNIWGGRRWAKETNDIIGDHVLLRGSGFTEHEVADVLRISVKDAVKRYRVTPEWVRKIKSGMAKFARGTNLLITAGVL